MFIGIVSDIRASNPLDLHDALLDYKHLPCVVICGNALNYYHNNRSDGPELLRALRKDLNIKDLIIIPGPNEGFDMYLYGGISSNISYCHYGPGPCNDENYKKTLVRYGHPDLEYTPMNNHWICNRLFNPTFSFFNPFPIPSDNRPYESAFLDINTNRKDFIKRWIFGDSDTTIHEVREGIEIIANPFHSPNYKPLIISTD